MMTAPPYRFYFKAICLAGFRVPAGKPASQSANKKVVSRTISRCIVSKIRFAVVTFLWIRSESEFGRWVLFG
jgi:hypothetical protein